MQDCNDEGTVGISGEFGPGTQRPWNLLRETVGPWEQFVDAVGTVGELSWEQVSGWRQESGLELENW